MEPDSVAEDVEVGSAMLARRGARAFVRAGERRHAARDVGVAAGTRVRANIAQGRGRNEDLGGIEWARGRRAKQV